MKKCITEVYSRVTGFFRPVKDWNKGKKEEYKERAKFDSAIDKGGDDNDGQTGSSKKAG